MALSALVKNIYQCTVWCHISTNELRQNENDKYLTSPQYCIHSCIHSYGQKLKFLLCIEKQKFIWFTSPKENIDNATHSHLLHVI